MRTTLWKLLSNDIDNHSLKYGITIPMIQRDYAQGRLNPKSIEIRNQFVSDIKDSIVRVKNEGSEPLELDFVYGYIQNDIFYPLDGQQRLTTLYLLHWYLAFKDGVLPNYSKKLSKFTYQIRQTSNDFFRKILDLDISSIDISDTEKTISEYIKNQSWFLTRWSADNTIFSCLNVIDLLHSKFYTSGITLKQLINEDEPPIVFNFLDIEELGISDDLYIKMNARGVSLTGFENLKAELSKLIKDSDFNTKHFYDYQHTEGISNFDMYTYFITKVDTVWSDFFWDLRNKETHVFDDRLLNLLSFIALTNQALTEPDSFENARNKFISGEYLPSFYQFIESNLLTENTIINYIDVLDFLVEKHKVYSDYNSFDNHSFNFSDILTVKTFQDNYGLLATERIRLYTIMHFLPLVRGLKNGAEELLKIERIIANLSSVNNVYNNYEDLHSSLKGVDDIIKNYSGDIYHQFVNTEISGFYKEQITEEEIKIILINKSEEWRDLIHEIELDSYLQGHILLLLKYSGIWDDYKLNAALNWDEDISLKWYKTLKSYFTIYKMYFTDVGIKDYDKQLFRSAMLSIGDYLIHSKNFHFVDNRFNRDISWKRFFRESDNPKYGKSLDVLKKLFDETDVAISDTENLKNILSKYKPTVNDWRLYFLDNPEFIFHLSGYVYFEKDNNLVYLLNASKYSVRAIEMRTLLLQKKLLKLGISTEISYSQEYSKSIISQIGKRKSKIIYDYNNTDQFTVIERGKGMSFYHSDKHIIEYIVSNYN
ncbi:hypothetical protein B0A69_00465 [Chryseobacterium shigense]|uniref:GmrSD restriction endonucleases N-terminal domain-containing protein n=1 Tax=Chryseobacterium shigense TaxID=297244 RepID=A0A1N7I046_9FLAO|nr:DUF262 domain-containing protein [Chryseobacterium shigense]PQA97844.1 hypothetical protein B0A69_00465 [Chryseobacterium shigense]SIS30380.1 Protein of unknown function DUF262 [Chryseobacterium shigense]